MIGIYAIRNTLNNKMYVGESIDIEARWKQHQEDLDNEKHHSFKLQAEWNRTSRRQFRFIVLEDFVFPFGAKIDIAKLQLVLFCREYYYMKKYKSKSQGYNIENTLKEVMSGSSKYPQFKDTKYKDFIQENKDTLLTDTFNLNILNTLCSYSSDENFGEMLYINANSSPQPINPIFTTYMDKKCVTRHKNLKAAKSKTDNIDNIDKGDTAQTMIPDKEKSSKNKKKTKTQVAKDSSLIPRASVGSYFGRGYIDKYTANLLYYKDIQDGFLTYVDDAKYHYAITDKGMDSGYYVLGNRETNGYYNGQLLLTEAGLQYYKNISTNILDYLPKEKIYKNEKNRYTIDIV